MNLADTNDPTRLASPVRSVNAERQQRRHSPRSTSTWLQAILLPLVFCLASAYPAAPATAQATQPARSHTPTARAYNAARRTEQAFDLARHQGPLELRAFLYAMPKGADLHMHLSGAIYAETFLRDAAEDGMCINPVTHSFEQSIQAGGRDPASGSSGSSSSAAFSGQRCGPGQVSAVGIGGRQHLYDAMIDAFSMRSFVATNGNSGHDHFFDTFDKFGGLSKAHQGEWIDEIATRAAAQNEQYLEIMTTPDFSAASSLASRIGFHANFGQYRQLLLDQGLRDSIPAIRAEMDRVEARRLSLEHCGQPTALPGCSVQVRYLFQVLRGLPRESVFAQSLLAFELASVDSRFVGLNFVMPEDGYTSMADYRLQMQMLDVLHGYYPGVHISLHAGELAPGLVPPSGLTFHIRSAVEQGHAERIGHGVDVMYENNPHQLLREMAARHVMVEINLTSNDVILGVKGDDHPLPIYRRYGVPVALSTDDEGVSRIDLTNEYVRAAVTYHLSYEDLKQMARTGIEHSFLPGRSLWRQDAASAESFKHPVAACRLQIGSAQPSGDCAAFVAASEKAGQQWELERRFHVFEAKF
jgi:adenosine deaminase